MYDELYNVVGDSDRELTPEDMVNFTYLEQVLKETLRMYPTISVFTRQLVEDIKVCKNRLYLKSRPVHLHKHNVWVILSFFVI